jgi:GST-like protein
MIEAYTARTSNGLRCAIALAESGLRHTVHPIDLSKGDQNAQSFRAMNPAGQIPVIVDKDVASGPLTLTESTAIMIHVAEKSGKLLPKEPTARARVFEAVANAMTDVYSPFNALFHIEDDFPGKVPAEVIADFDARIRAALTLADAKLAKSEWLAGDFSIADIALYPNVWRLEGALKRTYPDLKHLQRWRNAIEARPGVQLALSLKGRP